MSTWVIQYHKYKICAFSCERYKPLLSIQNPRIQNRMTLREFSPTQPVILGFDPGRDKCGLAIMGVDRRLHYHQVVSAAEAIATIMTLRQRFPISLLVMGDQTTAKQWKQQLHQKLADPLNIVLVDERYSSLEARDRYWQMFPPKGLRKLLPQGMRQPPRPIDDIVAILLIERYLNRLTENEVRSNR